MKKAKFDWKGYWQPTPKTIRKIADGLLVLSGSAAGILLEYGYQKYAVICMVAGLVFKFVSNMFKDSDETVNK